MARRPIARRVVLGALSVVVGVTVACSDASEDTSASEAHRNEAPTEDPPPDPNDMSSLVPVDLCDNDASALRYAPETGSLDAFPDDFHTRNAETPTGRRVNLNSTTLSLPPGTGLFHSVYDELSTQDGFGLTAQLFVRFAAELSVGSLPVSGPGSGSARASVALVELDSEPLRYIDFEWELLSDNDAESPDETLSLSPLQALKENTRYALYATNDLRDRTGGCIAPSQTMARVLQGTAGVEFTSVLPGVSSLVGALQDAETIDDAGELTLAVVFTTQSVSAESVNLTELVRAESLTYTPDGDCIDDGEGMLECQGTLNGFDYRGEDGIIT
ncbi:MAG: hypothetical protein AAF658_12420, partial [Myxococcota bacterium]